MVTKTDPITQESSRVTIELPTRTQKESPSGVPRKHRTRELEQLDLSATHLNCNVLPYPTRTPNDAENTRVGPIAATAPAVTFQALLSRRFSSP